MVIAQGADRSVDPAIEFGDKIGDVHGNPDHFAQGADRLGMMGKFGQGIVDPAIEFGDKIGDVHGVPPLSSVSTYSIRNPVAFSISSQTSTNSYYEAVFADLIFQGSLRLAILCAAPNKWAEIDTLEDLQTAQNMFAADTLNPEKAPS